MEYLGLGLGLHSKHIPLMVLKTLLHMNNNEMKFLCTQSKLLSPNAINSDVTGMI